MRNKFSKEELHIDIKMSNDVMWKSPLITMITGTAVQCVCIYSNGTIYSLPAVLVAWPGHGGIMRAGYVAASLTQWPIAILQQCSSVAHGPSFPMTCHYKSTQTANMVSYFSFPFEFFQTCCFYNCSTSSRPCA